MATLAHTLNIDYIFFDELVFKAYPKIKQYEFNFMRKLVKDGVIAIETLFEKSIGITGGLVRSSTNGMDFADGSDAKKVTATHHSAKKRKDGTFGPRSYSAGIKDVHTKVGILRVMCYERIQDRFYYFKIPNEAYSHIGAKSKIEIPFCQNGDPRRIPHGPVKQNWWNYEVQSFEEMSS